MICVKTKKGEKFELPIEYLKYSKKLLELHNANGKEFTLDNIVKPNLFEHIVDFLKYYDALDSYEFKVFKSIYVNPSFDIPSDKYQLSGYNANLEENIDKLKRFSEKKLKQMIGIVQYLEIQSLLEVITTIISERM